MPYKITSQTCGIYRIISPSGKFYIGSTNCFIKRKWEHWYLLKNNKHNNSILQSVWNKYQEELKFEILLVCEQKDLLFYEQLLIDYFKPQYNISKIAGSSMTGRKASIETKTKMSIARKGRKISVSTLEKLRTNWLGKHLSPEHKEKIRQSLKEKHLISPFKNKKHTEETKLKMKKAWVLRKKNI